MLPTISHLCAQTPDVCMLRTRYVSARMRERESMNGMLRRQYSHKLTNSLPIRTEIRVYMRVEHAKAPLTTTSTMALSRPPIIAPIKAGRRRCCCRYRFRLCLCIIVYRDKCTCTILYAIHYSMKAVRRPTTRHDTHTQNSQNSTYSEPPSTILTLSLYICIYIA